MKIILFTNSIRCFYQWEDEAKKFRMSSRIYDETEDSLGYMIACLKETTEGTKYNCMLLFCNLHVKKETKQTHIPKAKMKFISKGAKDYSKELRALMVL